MTKTVVNHVEAHKIKADLYLCHNLIHNSDLMR